MRLGASRILWNAVTFTKNPDQLLEGDMAAQFLGVVRIPRKFEMTVRPKPLDEAQQHTGLAGVSTTRDQG
jgi:hypothetical protein